MDEGESLEPFFGCGARRAFFSVREIVDGAAHSDSALGDALASAVFSSAPIVEGRVLPGPEEACDAAMLHGTGQQGGRQNLVLPDSLIDARSSQL